MALPVGVLTSIVTWGPFLDYLGVPLTAATVTIGASADITWSATGAALFRSALVATGTTGSMVLPGTDQAGFVAAGVPVKDWTYTATVQSPGQPDRVVIFTLPSGVTLDLDTLVPLDASSVGVVVNVPAIVSVNGQTGPAVTLTAASVGALPASTTPAQLGALPAEAPAVLKNTAANSIPFRVRSPTDASDVLTVTTAGTLTSSGGLTATAAVTSTQNDPNAVQATGAAGGIRFGGVSSQTFIQRLTVRALSTDSTWRVYTSNTAGRLAAATATAGGMAYDTSLQKPIWSDGTNWRDAAGTIV
jgi:hypothetical protein